MLSRAIVLSALIISIFVGTTSRAEARYFWNHTAKEQAEIQWPKGHNYRWAILNTDEIASDKCIPYTPPARRMLNQYEPWNFQVVLDRARAVHQGMRKAKSRCVVWGVGRPPHYAQWICIHGGEGAWDANTGNGYYGGLQMDYDFMEHYGALLLRTKGTADHWTPLEQMWVAEKAYREGRGFYPWPNTARACGLI